LQIARHLGAATTAVCRAENHALARSLGAAACHDYRIGPPCGEWDAILDIAGTLPWARARALLAPGGVLMPVTASLGQMLGAALQPRRGGRRITGATTSDGPAALARVLDLARAGVLVPVIAARLPLSGIAKAHALVDSGHKRGSVVVVVTDQATETAMAAK
jgi:NADPH:quinone reductase-like Zn-dependent oxidoreductase